MRQETDIDIGVLSRGPASADTLEDTAPSSRDILHDGIVTARAFAQSARDQERLALARGITARAVSAYWAAMENRSPDPRPIHDLPSELELAALCEPHAILAESMGTAAAALDVMEASYLMASCTPP
jgi:hypothetical protein